MTLKNATCADLMQLLAVCIDLCYNNFIVMIFLFCFALNIFAAVDQDSYGWDFLRKNVLRNMGASVEDGCSGTVDIECFHRDADGFAEVSGRLWKVIFSVDYATEPTCLSQIKLVYSDRVTAATQTHFFITSFASSLASTHGCVIMTPPDADPIVWHSEIIPGTMRPEFAWMCRGDAMGVEFKRFLFRCPAEKKACVGVKFVYADLPEVTVSWGAADANGDYAGEPQSRIFDLRGAVVQPYS